MTREERRAAAIERGAKVLRGVTIHPHKCPWGDDYWTHTLDANSRHKVADAVLDASGLLEDDYEQVGVMDEHGIVYEVRDARTPADVPVFRKVDRA